MDMDGNEVLVLITSLLLATLLWFRWYFALIQVTSLGNPQTSRAGLYFTPPVCAALLLLVLIIGSAAEVRNHPEYLLLFMLNGGAVVAVLLRFLPCVGLSVRTDAIETRNPAARALVCSAMLALTIIYAWANIGEGATIWMTLIPAAMGLSALAALWFALELCCRFADQITIERSLSAALHLSGFLLGAALMLGHAVAGDFQSWAGTICDFVELGLPTIVLAALAIPAELYLRDQPRTKSSLWARGVLPAAFHLSAAVFWVFITR